jgi:hypothetical protein
MLIAKKEKARLMYTGAKTPKLFTKVKKSAEIIKEAVTKIKTRA